MELRGLEPRTYPARRVFELQVLFTADVTSVFRGPRIRLGDVTSLAAIPEKGSQPMTPPPTHGAT